MKGKRRAARLLPVQFFTQPAAVVARELLGALVVSRIGGKRTSGRIVETEAYLGRDDPASHGYQLRRNARNEALFGPPGQWYVYLSYGIHWCANLVCWSHGMGSAVLLRALEPVEGVDVMRKRRGVSHDRLLCSGPGKLCQALAIDRSLDGKPVTRRPFSLTLAPAAAELLIGPRIGISKAADIPWRFGLKDSRFLSRRFA